MKRIVGLIMLVLMVLIGCGGSSGGSGPEESTSDGNDHMLDWGTGGERIWDVYEKLDSPTDELDQPVDGFGTSRMVTCISEAYSEEDTMFIVPVADMNELVDSGIIGSPIGRQIWMDCSDGTEEPTDDFYHMNQGDYAYYLYMKDKLDRRNDTMSSEGAADETANDNG